MTNMDENCKGELFQPLTTYSSRIFSAW